MRTPPTSAVVSRARTGLLDRAATPRPTVASESAMTRHLAHKIIKETLFLALSDYRVKIGGSLWPLPQGYVSARTRSSPYWEREEWARSIKRATLGLTVSSV